MLYFQGRSKELNNNIGDSMKQKVFIEIVPSGKLNFDISSFLEFADSIKREKWIKNQSNT